MINLFPNLQLGGPRAACCLVSTPSSNVAWLDLPGTEDPADTTLRVIENISFTTGHDKISPM